MKKIRQTITLLTLTFLMTSCGANYFQESFIADKSLKAYNKDLIKKGEEPKVYYLTDPERETVGIIENGFVSLGYSLFEQQEFNDKKQAIRFAKKIGASLVLIHSEYSRTEKLYDDVGTAYSISSAPPVSNTNPLNTQEVALSYDFSSKKLTKDIDINTAVQSWDVPKENRNYYAIPNGNGAIVIPNNVTVNTYFASFWGKTNYPPALGVKIKDIGKEIKNKLNIKDGVSVWAVDKNSPASKANIYRGDILLSINNEPIKDALSMGTLIRNNVGKTIRLEVYRDKKSIFKDIKLNETSF